MQRFCSFLSFTRIRICVKLTWNKSVFLLQSCRRVFVCKIQLMVHYMAMTTAIVLKQNSLVLQALIYLGLQH